MQAIKLISIALATIALSACQVAPLQDLLGSFSWDQAVPGANGANGSTPLRKDMAIDMLLELTGHHPLFCHHHANT